MELIMIKIGHIIDAETKGQVYLETFTGEVIKNEITLPANFECAVMEFDGERAIAHIETIVLELTAEEVEGKTIREALELKRRA
jgi:hypothetical protein